MAKKYDGSQQRGQGRPKTAADIAALIVRMASENSWGYDLFIGIASGELSRDQVEGWLRGRITGKSRS